MNEKIKTVLDWIFKFGMTAVITLLVINFIIQPVYVDGRSMEDTLKDGELLLMEKVSYRIAGPQRFDIVVFPAKLYGENAKETILIKRIIGLPGETIQIDDEGNILINGEILEEDYGKEVIEYAGIAAKPITLGENEYFLLGDNRNASSDSRFEQVGVISGDAFLGHVCFRLWPLTIF